MKKQHSLKEIEVFINGDLVYPEGGSVFTIKEMLEDLLEEYDKLKEK